MGKYGEEGDRLIFKILNSGDFLRKVDDTTYSSKDVTSLTPKISDKALRYDLTVPLARVVANYRNELPKFFKRYQIQPVWRGERPQEGRFREFTQADIDVVAKDTLPFHFDVEVARVMAEALSTLPLPPLTLRVNNRKLIQGFYAGLGAAEIRRRFVSSAMSLGALSPEAHATLSIAMNRMGARSNSGEGGEDPHNYLPAHNGDRADNRIKQVASARFGVTAAAGPYVSCRS